MDSFHRTSKLFWLAKVGICTRLLWRLCYNERRHGVSYLGPLPPAFCASMGCHNSMTTPAPWVLRLTWRRVGCRLFLAASDSGDVRFVVVYFHGRQKVKMIWLRWGVTNSVYSIIKWTKRFFVFEIAIELFIKSWDRQDCIGKLSYCDLIMTSLYVGERASGDIDCRSRPLHRIEV